jgi:hypothetical protein
MAVAMSLRSLASVTLSLNITVNLCKCVLFEVMHF